MFQNVNELAHYPVVQKPRDDSDGHREAARNGLAVALAQWRAKADAAPLKARHPPLKEEKGTYSVDGQTLFHRREDRLTSIRTDPNVTYRMIEVAEKEGWNKVSVKGSKKFRRPAWLYGSLAGIEVRGYEPKKGDLQRLETLKDLQNRLEPGKQEQGTVKPETGTKDRQEYSEKAAEDGRAGSRADVLPLLPDYQGRTALLPHQLDQALEGLGNVQKGVAEKAFRVLEEWVRKERLHPGLEEGVFKGGKTVFKHHRQHHKVRGRRPSAALPARALRSLRRSLLDHPVPPPLRRDRRHLLLTLRPALGRRTTLMTGTGGQVPETSKEGNRPSSTWPLASGHWHLNGVPHVCT